MHHKYGPNAQRGAASGGHRITRSYSPPGSSSLSGLCGCRTPSHPFTGAGMGKASLSDEPSGRPVRMKSFIMRSGERYFGQTVPQEMCAGWGWRRLKSGLWNLWVRLCVCWDRWPCLFELFSFPKCVFHASVGNCVRVARLSPLSLQICLHNCRNVFK